MALAKAYASKDLEIQNERMNHELRLAAKQQVHRERMEKRAWWLELILTVGAFAGIIGSLLVSWKYAAAGHILPGVSALGAGSAVSVGAYAAGREIRRKQRASRALETAKVTGTNQS